MSYYLAVGRGVAEQGFFTFDQSLPTNGFHPLWQYMLGGLYIVAHSIALSSPGVMIVTILMNLIAVSLSLFLLGKTFLSEFKQLPLLFLILPIGVYALLTFPLERFANSLWSNLNGMESSFVLLSYTALLWVMVRPKFLDTFLSAVITGTLLALVCLARLDHGFLAVAFFIVVGIRILVYREWSKIKFLVLSGVVALIILGVYLLSNYWSVGVWLPVSGTLKSTFPWRLNDKIPVIREIIANPSVPYANALSTRFAKIALPVVPAAGFLLWSLYLLWKRQLSWLATGLTLTSLFIIFLALYDHLYVPLWYQGDWYFPISLLFLSILLVYILGNLRKPHTQPDEIAHSGLALAGMALLFVIGVWFFLGAYWGIDRRSHYTRFFLETGPSLIQYYAPEKPKIIEVDDGVLTYATGFPAMSWLGFTLDPEGVAAKKKGQLLKLAVDRGYDRIASLNYFNARGLDPTTPSDEIAAALGKTFFLNPKQVEPYTFKVEFVSKDGYFAIIHVTPK